MICYYNGKILRTETNVKYGGRKAVIVPLDLPIECTFEELSDMIYSRTTIVMPGFPVRPERRIRIGSGTRDYILGLSLTCSFLEMNLYL